MDSLLANYASSDEEEEQEDNQQPPQHSNSSESLQPHKPPSSSVSSSLPKPQSSSLFSSLPTPKSQLVSNTNASSVSTFQNHGPTRREVQEAEKALPRDSNSGSKVSSGLFSVLPVPKSRTDSGPISSSSGSSSVSQKRVVQFRPPVIQPSVLKSGDKDDDEDDDDEEFEKKKPQTVNPNSSFKSFLSSMPAPTNSATLGTLSGSGGSGRRAIVETAVPILPEKEVGVAYNAGSAQHNSNNDSVSGSLGAAEGQLRGGVVAGGDVTNCGQTSQSYVGYEGYESYANYGAYANYETYGNDGNYDHSNWANSSSIWYAPEASGTTTVESVGIVSGKRGRDRVPTEIVEVNQDELMKNRPREDQVKLTGIAFGPAYQPAPSGVKPTKLHKRKHQIGSLYYDMKQKEMELAERRAKGMLTKAETQAKYGW